MKNLFQLSTIQKHSLFWLVIFWINLLLLLYLTLAPSVAPNVGYTHADKIYHFIGFGVLTFLSKLAYLKLSLKLTAIAMAALGLFVELAQSSLSYRTFSIADLLADIGGILFAVVILQWLKIK